MLPCFILFLSYVFLGRLGGGGEGAQQLKAGFHSCGAFTKKTDQKGTNITVIEITVH